MTSEKDTRAEEQAKAQYDSIREMVAARECDYDRLQELRDEREGWEPEEPRDEAHAKALDDANDTWASLNPEDAEELKELEEAAGECKDEEEARERIMEDPLSVQVRSDWADVGSEMTAGEFCILLCTGGPAARIMGELDDHGEPYRAWLEYQDWGTPWTMYGAADQDTLLTYARCFCFAS